MVVSAFPIPKNNNLSNPNEQNPQTISIFSFSSDTDTIYKNIAKKRRVEQKIHNISGIIMYALMSLFIFTIFLQKAPYIKQRIASISYKIQAFYKSTGIEQGRVEWSRKEQGNTEQSSAVLNNIGYKNQINLKQNTSIFNDFKFAIKILEYVNQARQKYRLTPLAISSNLQTSSITKAYLILNSQEFAHNLHGVPKFGNVTWQETFKMADIPSKINNQTVYVGENLGLGINDPKTLVQFWLSSKAHRQVLLNPKFTVAGISIVHGTIKGHTRTLTVMHFANLSINYQDNILYPYTNIKLKKANTITTNKNALNNSYIILTQAQNFFFIKHIRDILSNGLGNASRSALNNASGGALNSTSKNGLDNTDDSHQNTVTQTTSTAPNLSAVSKIPQTIYALITLETNKAQFPEIVEYRNDYNNAYNIENISRIKQPEQQLGKALNKEGSKRDYTEDYEKAYKKDPTPQMNDMSKTTDTREMADMPQTSKAPKIPQIPKFNTHSLTIYASSLIEQTQRQEAQASILKVVQIFIAIFALLVSAVYLHTAEHNKKKFILIEVLWAFILVIIGVG